MAVDSKRRNKNRRKFRIIENAQSPVSWFNILHLFNKPVDSFCNFLWQNFEDRIIDDKV